jgi:lysozyme family protein
MLSPHDVNRLIDAVIEREGGYVDHPKDPGGRTKYGISQRSYPDEDIRNLTVARARELYRRDFIEKHRIDEFSDYRTAELVLDWLVHSGPLAIRTLQRRLNVTVDGLVGPETLARVNQLELRQMLRWRLEFLIGLTGHPFIKGWVKRLFDLGL